MSKARRLLLAFSLAILLFAGLSVAPPGRWGGPQEAAAQDFYACSGYQYGTSITDGPTEFETRFNICLEYRGPGPGDSFGWRAVGRLLCYRNDVLFGSGDGGCRWDGHLRVEHAEHTIDNFFAKPGSESPDFIQDSGRLNSNTWSYFQRNNSIRACLRDGRVRFKALNGTVYPLQNMLDHCGPFRSIIP